jgi:hypothetical protein
VSVRPIEREAKLQLASHLDPQRCGWCPVGLGEVDGELRGGVVEQALAERHEARGD